MDTIVNDKISIRFQDVGGGVIIENNILHKPGGSGLLFADLLHREKCDYILYGKVGDDYIGDLIINYFDTKGINCHLVKTINMPTGESLIVRDASDIRMLVTSKESANNDFQISDVDYIYRQFSDANILYISGHFIKKKESERLSSTLALMSKFKNNNKKIILDIVPHNIYTEFHFNEYYEIIKHADIIFSDVSTIRRFLNLGNKHEQISDDKALYTGSIFHQYFENFSLRYGINGIDSEVVSNSKFSEDIFINKIPSEIITREGKLGFGDFLAVNALKTYFKLI